ncbi:unnamed protein product, partial [Rangifer tarandus platyrhynchus]
SANLGLSFCPLLCSSLLAGAPKVLIMVPPLSSSLTFGPLTASEIAADPGLGRACVLCAVAQPPGLGMRAALVHLIGKSLLLLQSPQLPQDAQESRNGQAKPPSTAASIKEYIMLDSID